MLRLYGQEEEQAVVVVAAVEVGKLHQRMYLFECL